MKKSQIKFPIKPKINLPKNYEPSNNEEYMCDMQLEYFKQKLLDWKKELIDESRETLDNLKINDWSESNSDNSATAAMNTGVELRTRGRYRKLINKIDKTIQRIDNGEYGYCEETDEPIGLKRLIARPIAALCLEAQERHEKHEKQHIDDDDLENSDVEILE